MIDQELNFVKENAVFFANGLFAGEWVGVDDNPSSFFGIFIHKILEFLHSFFAAVNKNNVGNGKV